MTMTMTTNTDIHIKKQLPWTNFQNTQSGTGKSTA
jgi:hypothetical protein